MEPTTGRWLPPINQAPDNNFHACHDRVKTFLRSNSLPVPSDLAAQIEIQICARLGDNLEWCSNGTPASTEQINAARKGWPVTFADFKAFTATVMDWILHGKERASDETISVRAAVCANCPFNLHPPGCTSCNIGSLRTILSPILAGHSHPMDGVLHGCSICGCDLRAKVRVPQDILLRHMQKDKLEKLPAHCWLKKA
jgi:hypothetical protein